MAQTTCPICGRDGVRSQKNSGKDSYTYECHVCGGYSITAQAMESLKVQTAEDNARISACTRERHIQRRPRVTILTAPPGVQSAERLGLNIEDIIASFPVNPAERLDRTLKNLHRLSRYPGAEIPMSPEEDYYPIFFAENGEAALFLREALIEEGWISHAGSTVSPAIMLTVRGWNRIAELEREKGRKDSRQAFVAMWFDSSLDRAYEDGFKKAIKEAGYEPLLIKLKEHNEKICDAIIAEVRKSRFLVADFTGHRGGVYFEAGYAMGLGIPVIWTCRDNHKKKLHFDTRQYNHILWKDETDLFDRLRQRIEATIPPD